MARIDTPAFFEELDKEFIHCKSTEDDRFIYQGKDVLVQSTWELPIIIQWPNSTIKFDFSTSRGGIEFGIVFVPATEEDPQNVELDVETIEEMTRVRSDLEHVAGTFQPPCEGVVFFLWDNAYDWSAVKKLSYTVEVHQPSFTLPDADRSHASKNLLLDMLEDTETAELRKSDAEMQIQYVSPYVETLRTKLDAMRLELAGKMAALSVAEVEEDGLIERVNSNYDHIAGIGIRSLNKHLISVVLSYLDLYGGGSGVCTYWTKCVVEMRSTGRVAGPEAVYHVRPEYTRRVPRGSSRGVSAQLLQATLTRCRAVEHRRWVMMGLDHKPPEEHGRLGDHAQWRLTCRRHVAMYPGREEYRHRPSIDRYDESVLAHTHGGSAEYAYAYEPPSSRDTEAVPHEHRGNALPQMVLPAAVVTGAEPVVRAIEAAAVVPPAPTPSSTPTQAPTPSPTQAPAPAPTPQPTRQPTQPPPPPPPQPALPALPASYPSPPLPPSSAFPPPPSAPSAPTAPTAPTTPTTPTPPAPPAVPASPRRPLGAVAATDSQTSSSPARASVITSGIREERAGIIVSTKHSSGNGNDNGNGNGSCNGNGSGNDNDNDNSNDSNINSNSSSNSNHNSDSNSNHNSDRPTPVDGTGTGNRGSSAPTTDTTEGTHSGPPAPQHPKHPQYPQSPQHPQDHREQRDQLLLVHVKEIRSEQQLATLIECIQDGYIAIEQADNDKRTYKKAIKQWNYSFEQYHSRPATNQERKAMAREMYESYQQASALLKVRCDKVNHILETVGLTHQGFLKLREKYVEWAESHVVPSPPAPIED